MKMHICRKYLSILSVLPLLGAGGMVAQQRLNDKDLEETMKNLKEDAEQFRSDFDSAVSKSTIRNTDQEKQAKVLVEHFQKKTEDMFGDFKDTKTICSSFETTPTKSTKYCPAHIWMIQSSTRSG